jgi:outer membrane protein OmpA-like peptidoglycan-associated protein
MKKTVGFAAMALLSTVSATAFADPTYGPYGTVSAGPSFVTDVQPSEQSGETADLATSTSFKTGYRATGALGFGFGNGLRTELELGWGASDVSTGTGSLSNNGRATEFNILGNVLYDFETGTPWTPHVGVGVGIGNDRIGGVNFPAGIQPIDTFSHVFTYQGIAGLEYTFAPQFHLGLDYRYIGTSDITVSPGSDPALPHSASFNLDSHNVLLTLRLDLESPPAAPIAAPPPPPPAILPPPPPPPHVEAQRSFQVFFDFNKSEITAAAAKVIAAAAESVRAGNVTQILVTGHTDTVGSAVYNQGLSERRAAAVKGQLVTDGVAEGEISTRGVGKEGLLVPTADGVREAQNRRAEIVLE